MKKKITKILLIALVVIIALSSCSAKNGIGRVEMDGFEGSADKEYVPETSNPSTSGSLVDKSTSDAPATDGRKIIETISLSVQTKEFDRLLDSINAQISTLGGYIENSNISGREIESTKNRSATFIIRIPCEKTSEFSEFVSDNSVVINESIATKDVTLSYVDMESRVSALESEKATLEKLLDSASTMSDIVDIRDKLTDVIYEIESYKSQLRTYDNLVDYSTVNIHIYEVERTIIVEEQTVFEKIGSNLKNNFENVWNGAVNMFIFIVSAIPYLIPVGIIAVIVIISVRAKIKKKKKVTKPTDNE